MIDLDSVEHHPAVQEMVDVLLIKTQNTDRGYFQAVVAYFLATMASSMRASVLTRDRGDIPVNIYSIALAASGFGKGLSINILENEFLHKFKQVFLQETLPELAKESIQAIAEARCKFNPDEDPEEYADRLTSEYEKAGIYPFVFDAATTAALQQLRQKLLLASAGAINFQADEIGSNLLGNQEALNVFLELYDRGFTKQKITKVTKENLRGEYLDGSTPANALLFGTPTKLLDGGHTEEEFFSFLETGYARRCLFGWGQTSNKARHKMTAEEIYYLLSSPQNDKTITKWADYFEKLADKKMYLWQAKMEDPEGIKLLEYRLHCEEKADKLPEHEEVRKAEISHRYFKALKLSGLYAFLDQSRKVTETHLHQAIKLVEESGEAFQAILRREMPHEKLAKYLAACTSEVTQAELVQDLPFYKGRASVRAEMMSMAAAWGYRNHIIIQKSETDGIEFFRGETLQKTDLDQLLLSYGAHWAYGYKPHMVRFEQLHRLVVGQQTNGEPLHWANHHFKNDHRSEDNTIPGFNLIVLDVDQGTTIPAAIELLKDYKFLLHTTKSHTDEAHRFRMVLPINYHLEMEEEEYHQFMVNFLAWLPFEIDASTIHRSKTWESFGGGKYRYNREGEILDILRFIPRTSKNEQHLKEFQEIESLPHLERWFAQRISTGNRNNHMLRYALALVDDGKTLAEVRTMVHDFNSKLKNALPKGEINSTILRTVAKRYQ